VNVTVLGLGNVGGALAARLADAGHDVVAGVRDPASPAVVRAVAGSPGISVVPLAGSCRDADVAFLAVPFTAATATLAAVGDLAGTIVVDCTNPVGPGLTHGLGGERSGSESIRDAIPGVRLVKAFTIYGWENIGDSRYPGYGDLRPCMLVAGDDDDAKRTVRALCDALGFEPIDAGPLAASLHLEHMTLLWIRLARVRGDGPHFTWARLTRAAPPSD